MMLTGQVARIDHLLWCTAATHAGHFECRLRLYHRLVGEENEPPEQAPILAGNLLHHVLTGQFAAAGMDRFPATYFRTDREIGVQVTPVKRYDCKSIKLGRFLQLSATGRCRKQPLRFAALRNNEGRVFAVTPLRCLVEHVDRVAWSLLVRCYGCYNLFGPLHPFYVTAGEAYLKHAQWHVFQLCCHNRKHYERGAVRIGSVFRSTAFARLGAPYNAQHKVGGRKVAHNLPEDVLLQERNANVPAGRTQDATNFGKLRTMVTTVVDSSVNSASSVPLSSTTENVSFGKVIAVASIWFQVISGRLSRFASCICLMTTGDMSMLVIFLTRKELVEQHIDRSLPIAIAHLVVDPFLEQIVDVDVLKLSRQMERSIAPSVSMI
uniref:Uncharacterized protein n=1 Tax=Anopheles merus TaxID=30066 RepID=A0A182VMM2_ANOME